MTSIRSEEEVRTGLVLVEKKNGVCRLTMNRPRIMNAFDFEMGARLAAAFEEISRDRETRVVILEGSGDHFSSGADMHLLNEDYSSEQWLWLMKGLSRLITVMRELPQPIICQVRGVAYGLGSNLALAGDFVVASETMRFCEVFSNIGVIMDGGGHYFLPRLVGLPKAMELALLGEEIDGPTAASMGLIYKCVPDEALEEEVQKLALKLSQKPGRALALIKEGLVGSFDMTLKEVMEWEASHQAIMLRGEEHKAIVKAFLELKQT